MSSSFRSAQIARNGSGNSYDNRHVSISEQPIAGILPPFGGDDTSKHNGICHMTPGGKPSFTNPIKSFGSVTILS